jgi:hypothetical protein
VPPAILVGTAFSLFGAFGSVRRRLTRRVAREVDSPADV